MSVQSPSPTFFFDTINAYQRTEALRAAIELDLFSQLSNGPKSSAELAVTCKSSERGVRILADYLTIIGLLHKVDRAYRLTPDTAMFLDRNSPAYLGGTLGFLLTPQLKECFHELTNAVRQGGTAVSDEGTVSDDNQIWVEFANVMGPLMHLPSMKLVELIGGDPQRPLRVLDVAAGHGLFGITVAKHFPNATVTALDWPNVLNVAAENAAKAGVLNRFQRLSGNAFDVEWGGPFDVVLLTNILHHFDVDRCEHLVRRAFASLAPQGRAITLEFIPNEDRISPASTATFALTMLATTARGDAYTFAEYDHMFQKAGFVRSEFHSIIPTPQQAIVSYKS